MKKFTLMKGKLLCAIVLMSGMTSYSANIINNGGFENNLTNWYVLNNFTGVGVSVDEGVAASGTKSAKILVNETPTDFKASALASIFNLQKGATYKVRFKAKASSNTTLAVLINELFETGNTLQSTAELSTEFQQFEFTTSDPILVSDHNGCLMFSYLLVSAGTTIWIDDVELSIAGGVDFYNCVANGEFDEPILKRDFDWWLSGNNATVTVDNASKLSGANSILLQRNDIFGNWTDLQIYPWIALQKGSTYKISFEAAGSADDMKVGVFLDYTYAVFWGYNSSSLIKTTKATYSHFTNEWPYENIFENASVLRFIDFNIGSTWLDNIRIVPYSVNLTSSTVLSNVPVGSLVGELMPLTDEPGITYQLSLPDMSTDPNYSNSLFSVEGIKLKTNTDLTVGEKLIRIGITDSNGGFLTKDMTISVTEGSNVSVPKFNKENDIIVYRQASEISILNAERSNVKIYDITGKLYFSGKLINNTEKVAIPNIKPGVYVVAIEKAGVVKVKKVVM